MKILSIESRSAASPVEVRHVSARRPYSARRWPIKILKVPIGQSSAFRLNIKCPMCGSNFSPHTHYRARFIVGDVCNCNQL